MTLILLLTLVVVVGSASSPAEMCPSSQLGDGCLKPAVLLSQVVVFVCA